MNAQQLFEIVKDVPKAAWPKDFAYGDTAWWDGSHTVDLVYSTTAAHTFIGSMTTYLIDTCLQCVLSHYGGEYNVRDGIMPPRVTANGDSLLETLAAACKLVGEGKQ